jgi:hypothetical protein
MSPDSSPEPDRFFTVQDARKLVEHFSPELPISDDKIRRYCREGKIVGQQVDKRWVMTLGALFQAELVPLEALDAYGEVLDIPDSVPEEWGTPPLAPHEPGPLERMLAADAAAQAAADDGARYDEANGADEVPVAEAVGEDPETDPAVEPVPLHDEARDDALTGVVDDEDDADLAPERPVAAGLAGADSPRTPQRRGPWPRRRALAIAVPIAVVLAGVGIVATSGDRSTPAQAQAQPSAATVQVAEKQREREREVELRTTMKVAAKHGDYRAAIANAERLGNGEAAATYRAAAASTLVKRARAAAERGDLDRARGLVQQSRRYVDSAGAKQVDRRIDEIERARRARAAKRKRDAARRAASRRASPAGPSGTTSAPSQVAPEPSTSSPTPSNSSSPSPSPAAPSGGSSSGGGSRKKPSTNDEFDYLGG